MYNDRNLKLIRKQLRKQQTPQEYKLWQILKNKQFYGYKFFRQYSVGNYILDFYCPQLRLAIELDGGQHNEDLNKSYDQVRSNSLNNSNIKVIRFWNNDINDNIEGVYEELTKILTPLTPLNLRGE